MNEFVDAKEAGAAEGLRRVLQRLVQRVRNWFDPTLIGPRIQRAREVLNFAAHRARELRLPQVAASLTFTTVLAIVPLLAVMLSIFATFPMFSEFRLALEKTLIRELLPEQYAAQLMRSIGSFAAKATQLTAIGLGFLFVTAMLMIGTVDRVLNEMWQVRQQRPVAQRVLMYWALISLGPLVIGASLAATSYLLSMSTGMVRQMPALLRALLDYLPIFLSGFAYAALYVLVPNRKVQWKDALVGGFVAAVTGDIIKDAFAAYIKAGVVGTIYGAFAVVPLFLIWVYLSWFIALFGAAIASTIPALRSTRFGDERRPGNDFITAVALLRVLHHALETPHPERLAESLSRETRTRLEDTERLLGALEALGYVRQLAGARTGHWRMVCDVNTVTLRPLFERLAVDPGNSLLRRDRLGIKPWLGLQTLELDRPLVDVRTLAAPSNQAESSTA